MDVGRARGKLFDNARVKSNENQVTGSLITYNMTKQVVEATGSAQGAGAPPNSRVKVIIVPAKKEEAGKAPPPPAAPPKLKADTEVK